MVLPSSINKDGGYEKMLRYWCNLRSISSVFCMLIQYLAKLGGCERLIGGQDARGPN